MQKLRIKKNQNQKLKNKNILMFRGMKKLLFSVLFALMITFGLTSCNSCSSTPQDENTSKTEVVDTVSNVQNLIVENCISTDRQNMYLNYKEDYRWFETGITLNKFMDAEDTDATVESVYNVFQIVTERGEGFDTQVVCMSHKGELHGTEVKAAFWVGDCLLNEEEIKLTFEQAYNRLMEANLPKPHSRQCVLRKELGPKDINAQYIFGNVKEHVYVDAVTGDVKTENPAYEGFDVEIGKLGYAFNWLKDRKGYFGGPLGEWP